MKLRQVRTVPASRPDIPETADSIARAKAACEAARAELRAEGVPWNCAPPIGDEQLRVERECGQ